MSYVKPALVGAGILAASLAAMKGCHEPYSLKGKGLALSVAEKVEALAETVDTPQITKEGKISKFSFQTRDASYEITIYNDNESFLSFGSGDALQMSVSVGNKVTGEATGMYFDEHLDGKLDAGILTFGGLFQGRQKALYESGKDLKARDVKYKVHLKNADVALTDVMRAYAKEHPEVLK